MTSGNERLGQAHRPLGGHGVAAVRPDTICVLVVDNDRPANAVSQGVGGLLGHDRVKPADLRDSGQRQLREHANVELRHGAVEDAKRTRDGFVVRPTDGPPASSAPRR